MLTPAECKQQFLGLMCQLVAFMNWESLVDRLNGVVDQLYNHNADVRKQMATVTATQMKQQYGEPFDCKQTLLDSIQAE